MMNSFQYFADENSSLNDGNCKKSARSFYRSLSHDISHEYLLLLRRFRFLIPGKYRPGHPSSVNDPKTWKANFRCAINSLPDVVEVKEMNVNSKRGPNAYKVYTFLPPKSRKRAKRKYFVFNLRATNINAATSCMQCPR